MTKFLRENREYQLKDGRFVIVSRLDMIDEYEIMVFPSDGEGNVVSYDELYGCYGDKDMSDEAVLKAFEDEE
jgi:hypothetical protein